MATAAIAALAACDGNTSETFGGGLSRSWNPAGVSEVEDVPVADLRAEIARRLEAEPRKATGDQWRHVRTLYSAYSRGPLWLDEDGLIDARTDALIDALAEATQEAMRIDVYPLGELARALTALDDTDEPATALLAEVDLLLTTTFVALGEDYLTGQVEPRSVAQSWHIDTREEQVDSALARSLRDEDLAEAIGRMRPQDYDYEMLRRTLADYRQMVAAGGWPTVPGGKALKRGDPDSPKRIEALRARLRAEGIATEAPVEQNADSQPKTARAVYDRALARAVAEFQMRHGIAVDSMLGSETIDAMNVPATFRLAQVAANLERYRWLPRTLGNRYILVNVPAFRLQGFENGRKTIEMKVIVGAEYEGRATPVFADSMEYVIFRPYWDVPPGIAEKELWPQYAAGGLPGDFVVTSQDGRPHLRQRPGPRNALGLVKFMFPNDFNIYLHDTPNADLFEKDVRGFSHGCIRVERPEELATWVLGWDRARVQKSMHDRDDRRVNLPVKIPVYIAYFTAYVRNGGLWFGNDLYMRDDRLVAAVADAAMPSAQAIRAIEAVRKAVD